MTEPLDLTTLHTGDVVTYLYTPRRGYGYAVSATVVKVNAKTVRIEVPLVRGGTRIVNVKPESLRR